ncbi:MAG: DUF11 domain-containing protein [Spirosomataceae bacterium]
MKFNVKNPTEPLDRSSDQLLVVNPTTRKLAQRPISDVMNLIDNLTSTDTDKPLTANQGKILKALIDALASKTKAVWLFNPMVGQIDAIQIRRAYNFTFSIEVAYNCQVITQPPAQSLANTNYVLSYQATAANSVLVVIVETVDGSTFNPGVAQLSFDLATTTPTVSPNTSFDVTVKVTNSGPNPATNIVSEVYLPVGMQLVQVASSSSYTYSYFVESRTLRFFYTNSVASSANVQAVITLRGTQTGNITGQIVSCNQANVNAQAGNGILGEIDDDTLAITIQAVTVDLSLGMSISNSNPTVNQTLTMTVTLSNLGSNNATNVIWSGELPSGLTFVGGNGVSYNATANMVSATVATIAPSVQDVRTFQVSVKSNAVLTTQNMVVSIAQVTETDSNTANNSAAVSMYVQGVSNNPDPAVATDGDVWLLDAEYQVVGDAQYGGGTGNESGTRNLNAYLNTDVSERYPQVNTNFTLSIYLRNDSSNAYTNETILLTLPTGISYVSAVTNNYTYNNNIITVTISSLPVGGIVLAQALVKATTTGAKTLTATLNNSIHSASVSVTPQQTQRDISAFLAIDATNTTPAYNETITVSLYVRNDSGSAYSNEVFRHIIPSGKLQFVAFTNNPSSIASVNQGVLTASLNLSAGAAVLIQFTATVIASSAGAFQITETIDGTIHSASKTINYGN